MERSLHHDDIQYNSTTLTVILILYSSSANAGLLDSNKKEIMICLFISDLFVSPLTQRVLQMSKANP